MTASSARSSCRDHLCAAETVLGTVPNIQRREFVCVCTHADQPGGGKLLVERSIEHDAYTADGRSVRGWRFCAISVQPRPVLTNTPSSSYTNSPACSAGEGSSFGRSANEEVEVTLILQVRCCCFVCPRATMSQTLRSETAPFFLCRCVCTLPQVDLGSIAERFTSEYALEHADIINPLIQYMALPGWAEERARLLAEGPRMPKERKEQPTSLPTSQNGSFKQKQPKASRRSSSNGSGGRRPSVEAVDVADDGDDEHDEERWTASRVSSAHRRPRYPPRRYMPRRPTPRESRGRAGEQKSYVVECAAASCAVLALQAQGLSRLTKRMSITCCEWRGRFFCE